MFRSYDHHQGGLWILAKITFIYNTMYVPILKTGDVAACCHIASFNIGISKVFLIKVILARN